MGKTLVVVESPAKAIAVKKYLGGNYEVLATKGHVKDLPEKGMCVDIQNGFQEMYVLLEGQEEFLAELRAAVKEADLILLATDPDREGEAIAWHIYEELASFDKPINRVEFQEITKKGIKLGIASPRDLNKNL